MKSSNWLLALLPVATLVAGPATASTHDHIDGATLGVTPEQGYQPLNYAELIARGYAPRTNPSGSSYAGGPLVQDGISAFFLSSGPHTQVWSNTTHSIGTNGLSGAPMSMAEFYLPGAGPNGGDIIQVNVFTVDRSPLVPIGSVSPNGPFTSWRFDLGIGAHPDAIEFSPAPQTVLASGHAWFNGAGAPVGTFGLGLQSPGIGNSGSAVGGLGVVGLGGANIAGFDLAEGAIFFELTPPVPPIAAYCFGDGTGTACPCANNGGSGQGCANETAAGSTLGWTGSASIGSNDLVLSANNLPTLANTFGMFFQGASAENGGLGNPFGDGLFCANSVIVRLEVAPSVGGVATSSVSISGAGGATVGTTLYYQFWYRSVNGPCGSGFNLSSAVSVPWQS